MKVKLIIEIDVPNGVENPAHLLNNLSCNDDGRETWEYETISRVIHGIIPNAFIIQDNLTVVEVADERNV